MSEDCLGKPCIICQKPIRGANYCCEKCKSCICFYCGADMLKEADVDKLG